jgi:serine/threonine-protein kinase
MAPDHPSALRVGTTLCNKWTLDRLIGTGGMAAVYEATHKIGRREAIKILHPDIARDKELCARFEQEAHAVNRFKHPGAVEIRDIDVAAYGAPFLVMELLDGQPLGDLARRPRASRSATCCVSSTRRSTSSPPPTRRGSSTATSSPTTSSSCATAT